jgi:antitoxin component YwqK of YwqJK toxin-antitoxin module
MAPKMFEGEYQYGKHHGKSINWHKNGNKEYEGEYQDGKLL